MSQNGSFSQVGVKIKHIWNHHLDVYFKHFKRLLPLNKPLTKTRAVQHWSPQGGRLIGGAHGEIPGGGPATGIDHGDMPGRVGFLTGKPQLPSWRSLKAVKPTYLDDFPWNQPKKTYLKSNVWKMTCPFWMVLVGLFSEAMYVLGRVLGFTQFGYGCHHWSWTL